MIVRYCGGRRFEIEHRQHRVMTDQPVERRGEDTALTPTELFVGALAACAALYAAAVAVRHGLQREDLSVEAEWHEAEEDTQVDRLSFTIRLARPVEPGIAKALHRAAEQCSLHRTMRNPPPVELKIAQPV